MEAIGTTPNSMLAETLAARAAATPPPIAAPLGGDEAAEVGAKFEEIFLRLLAREMLAGATDGFFGRQAGASVYRDMFAGTLAEGMARRGTLGIKDLVTRELRAAAGQEWTG